MTHRVKIMPMRLRERDAALGCDRLRVIGYRAVCECGAKSPVEVSVTDARRAPIEHTESEGAHRSNPNAASSSSTITMTSTTVNT